MFDLWFGFPIDPIATFPDFAERIIRWFTPSSFPIFCGFSSTLFCWLNSHFWWWKSTRFIVHGKYAQLHNHLSSYASQCLCKACLNAGFMSLGWLCWIMLARFGGNLCMAMVGFFQSGYNHLSPIQMKYRGYRRFAMISSVVHSGPGR